MLTNYFFLFIISSIITVGISQLLKTVLKTIITGSFNRETLTSDGDFPSSHTAFITNINTIFWYTFYLHKTQNPNADMFAAFSVGIIFAVILVVIIRDAMGVRLRVQEHAEAISELLKSQNQITERIDINLKITKDLNSKTIQETIEGLLKNHKLKAGHLPHEVIGGLIIGVISAANFIGLHSLIFYNNKIMLLISFPLFILYIFITLFIFIREKKRKEMKRKGK